MNLKDGFRKSVVLELELLERRELPSATVLPLAQALHDFTFGAGNNAALTSSVEAGRKMYVGNIDYAMVQWSHPDLNGPTAPADHLNLAFLSDIQVFFALRQAQQPGEQHGQFGCDDGGAGEIGGSAPAIMSPMLGMAAIQNTR